MINPEKLDLSALPSLPLLDKKRLPELSAVYFCIDSSGNVLYIGKSKNLNRRWLWHHRRTQLKDIDGVCLAWMETPSELLLEVESALITWFKPSLNWATVLSNNPRICGYVSPALKSIAANFAKRQRISESELITDFVKMLESITDEEFRQLSVLAAESGRTIVEEMGVMIKEILLDQRN